MNNAADILDAIKKGKMSHYQILIVALCTLIAGLDGFDVLVVAYTGPAISINWGLAPTDLGLLFSAGLAGMGLGAVAVAPIGDIVGRKPTIMFCMMLLLVGMGLSAFTSGLGELAFMRLVTGIGIGGILANVNIMVTEYSSARRKALCVSLMALGYPVGATLGGIFSVFLIQAYGWQSVYLFGAGAAALLLPLIWIAMPESVDYLIAKKPANALERCNRILSKMGMPQLDLLPTHHSATETKPGLFALLKSGDMVSRLFFTSVVYFTAMMTCYFLLSWTPQILTKSGMTQTMGISGSLLMNLGGIAGCLVYGFLAQKLGPRTLAAALMLGLVITAVSFAAAPGASMALLIAAIAVGFCLFSAVNSLYVLVPGVFPVHVRSTGTGIAMGAGRLGAVAGPLLAGYLIAMGLDKTVYIAILSAPMIIAAIVLVKLRPFQDSAKKSVDISLNPMPTSGSRPLGENSH